LPRQLKAAAGPSPDPEEYNYEPGMELISITEETKVEGICSPFLGLPLRLRSTVIPFTSYWTMLLR
jgi:hypothetical protein